MKGVQIDPPFSEKASRLELFVRFFYFILYYIVATFGIIFLFTCMIQGMVILLLGKRSKTLHTINRGFTEYLIEFMAYLYLLTEERPKLIPKF